MRPKLTYANVMATIAVFLVLGGGAAYAASHLGKNTVGPKQLKKNAVTTAKIKNQAVTGAKIKNGTVTGSKIELSSLGTVPSAMEASATNGIHMTRIHFLSGANEGKTGVFAADGLTLFAECSAGQLEFTATTSIADTEIYESGNYISTFNGEYNESFTVGDVEKVGKNIGNGAQAADQGQLLYSTAEGAVVSVQFSLKEYGTGCFVAGLAQYS